MINGPPKSRLAAPASSGAPQRDCCRHPPQNGLDEFRLVLTPMEYPQNSACSLAIGLQQHRRRFGAVLVVLRRGGI